jgi:hypothetical protein
MKTLVYVIEFVFHASSFRTLQKCKKRKIVKRQLMRQLRQQRPIRHHLRVVCSAEFIQKGLLMLQVQPLGYI